MRITKQHLLMASAVIFFGIAALRTAAADENLRPPAVPLVVSNPYLSIWSEADRLNGDVTRHWTGRPHSLNSLIRIDGRAFRLMGIRPGDAPAFPQVGLHVTPTRTIYDFDDTHVHVTLTFLTPSLPDDLDALARPVTYLTWRIRSTDEAEHKVSLLVSASGELAVHSTDQKVTWSGQAMGSWVRRKRSVSVFQARSADADPLRRRHADRLGLCLPRRSHR